MFCRCSRGRCGLYGGCLGQRVDVTCPAPLLAALAFMALTACALVLATSEVGMLGYRLSFQRVHAAGGARAAQHFAARPPAQHGGARASTTPAVDGDERRTEAPRKRVYETARPRTSATAGEAMDCEPSAAQSGATTTHIPHLIHQVRVARVRCPSRGGRAVSTVPCWRSAKFICAILASGLRPSTVRMQRSGERTALTPSLFPRWARGLWCPWRCCPLPLQTWITRDGELPWWLERSQHSWVG